MGSLKKCEQAYGSCGYSVTPSHFLCRTFQVQAQIYPKTLYKFVQKFVKGLVNGDLLNVILIHSTSRYPILVSFQMLGVILIWKDCEGMIDWMERVDEVTDAI